MITNGIYVRISCIFAGQPVNPSVDQKIYKEKKSVDELPLQ